MTGPWGTEIGVEIAGGVPLRLFHPRPRHLSAVLTDGEAWGDRVHLVQGDRELTFAEVVDGAHRVAATLRASGLRGGGRVMLVGHGAPEWVVGFWAIVAAGGVVTLGNAWWSDDELAHALAVSTPDVIVADAAIAARLAARASHDAPVIEWSSLLAGDGDGDGDASPAPSTPPAVVAGGPDESDPAVVLFTSGTTGKAKGAILSHRALIAALHSTLYVTRRLPYEPGSAPPDVMLSTGPLFHIGGIYALLQALLFGRTLVFLRGRFDAGEVLDVIESRRVERWPAVPTMLQRVLDHPSLPDRDVSSVRSLAVGGSALPAGLLERMQQAFPNASRHVSQVYGLTEAGGTLTSTSSRDDSASQPGLVGQPMPLVELRIDRPDEAGIGEIVARTPTQMTGYLGTTGDGVIDADGWLHTGDLGRLDDDGRLFLTGRSKDLIIRGGENVAAAHVERVLGSCPGVLEVAVLGLPHEDLGEEVAAAVFVAPGSDDLTERLRAHAKQHLAYFERPTRWCIRHDGLPLNSVGKVDKLRLVREWPVAELETQSAT
ncbi:class I adenylate-forming enzyme family protein [Desertimonas flava]|uniref:class I adenylate-forming enzyme family protein n=1 Tax=Desertimonas flava TaxID=2064846 RepID=UPI000E34AA95|nr:class I adenylate-forming enzyme family protein [Desertimonas flava]